MRSVLVCILGFVVLGSCGSVDVTSGHFPGTTVYEPDGAGYHLHYPNPPWEEADPGADYGAFHPALVVPPVVFGHRLDVDPHYMLQIDHLDCANAAAAAESLMQVAAAGGEQVDYGPRSFRNVADDEGVDFAGHDGSLRQQLPAAAQDYVEQHGLTVRARRVVFGAASGCFQLLVVSVYELDEAGVTDILRSFEPRASGAATGDGGGP